MNNNEEELGMPEIMNRVKEKNNSEDNNIDHPCIQRIKDKYHQIIERLSLLEEQIKILFCNISITKKNKPQINQICQLIRIPSNLIKDILNGKNIREILKIK